MRTKATVSAVLRFFLRLLGRLAWWQKLILILITPLLLLNLAVAFFGNSVVSPLSPFFLEDKLHALGAYAKHRPGCLFKGHPDLREVALEAESRHRLPVGLMRALVKVESEDEPHRISFAGAMGPVQLMPGTAEMLDVGDPFDTTEAVDAGARYLAKLIQRKGDIRLGIASYNAGPGSVGTTVPRNGETELYVEKVMRAMAAERADPAPRHR
jgi:hypothetical protein